MFIFCILFKRVVYKLMQNGKIFKKKAKLTQKRLVTVHVYKSISLYRVQTINEITTRKLVTIRECIYYLGVSTKPPSIFSFHKLIENSFWRYKIRRRKRKIK